MPEKAADIFLRTGVLTKQGLQAAQALKQRDGGTISEAIVRLGLLDEEHLVAAFQKNLSIARVSAAALARVPRDVLSTVPPHMAAELRVIPTDLDSTGNLTLAMVDPTDDRAADEVAAYTQRQVQRAVASPTAMREALRTHYGVQLGKPGAGGGAPAAKAAAKPAAAKPAAAPADKPAAAPAAAKAAPAAAKPAAAPAAAKPVAAPAVTKPAASAVSPAATKPAAAPAAAPKPAAAAPAPEKSTVSPATVPAATKPAAAPAATKPAAAPAATKPIAAKPAVAAVKPVAASAAVKPMAAKPVVAAQAVKPVAAAAPVKPVAATAPVKASSGPAVVAKPAVVKPVAAPAAMAPAKSATESTAPAAAAGSDVDPQSLKALARAINPAGVPAAATPDAPPKEAAHFAKHIERLRAASERDQVVAALLDCAEEFGEAAALFVQQQKQLACLDGRGPDHIVMSLKWFSISTDEPSPFSEVMAAREAFCGRLPETAVNQSLKTSLGSSDGEQLFLPLTVGNRSIGVLYVDEIKKNPKPFLPGLQYLAQEAGGAFARIIMAKKKS